MAFFGLDIGSSTIKIIQLQKKEGKFHLVSAGVTKVLGGGIYSELEKDFVELAEVIIKLKTEAGVGLTEAITSFPESAVFTRVIELPAMNEEEVGQALKWELDEIVPIPLTEAVYDWQVVRSDQNSVSVLVAVSPQALVKKYLHIFDLAHLQPVAFETEVLAMVRALSSVVPERVKLIVDIGNRFTSIVAARGPEIILTRSMPTAGKALTRAVSTNLRLDEEVAEEYKKTYGLLPGQTEGKVKEVILPILKVIIDEVQKSISYIKEEKKSNVEAIILCGGTSNLPGISELIAENLKLEVQLADPLANLVYDENLHSPLKKIAPSLVVAVGLAMREV